MHYNITQASYHSLWNEIISKHLPTTHQYGYAEIDIWIIKVVWYCSTPVSALKDRALTLILYISNSSRGCSVYRIPVPSDGLRLKVTWVSFSNITKSVFTIFTLFWLNTVNRIKSCWGNIPLGSANVRNSITSAYLAPSGQRDESMHSRTQYL